MVDGRLVTAHHRLMTSAAFSSSMPRSANRDGLRDHNLANERLRRREKRAALARLVSRPDARLPPRQPEKPPESPRVCVRRSRSHPAIRLLGGFFAAFLSPAGFSSACARASTLPRPGGLTRDGGGATVRAVLQAAPPLWLGRGEFRQRLPSSDALRPSSISPAGVTRAPHAASLCSRTRLIAFSTTFGASTGSGSTASRVTSTRFHCAPRPGWCVTCPSVGFFDPCLLARERDFLLRSFAPMHCAGNPKRGLVLFVREVSAVNARATPAACSCSMSSAGGSPSSLANCVTFICAI